jgi:hypothetical protein
MKLQVVARGCQLTPGDERQLLRRVERLTAQLERFDPDLVHLEVVINKQARRSEFTSRLRLVVMEHVLPVHRNAAPHIRTVLTRAFDDLERSLIQFNEQMRGATGWQRKRSARSARRIKQAQAALINERALLDRALAGERTAFEVLADTRLAGLRNVIFELLTERGGQPSDDELDQALGTTLAVAFEQLERKPERWSIHGWLSWIARRELRRHVPA